LVALAEKLITITPGSFKKRVAYGLSGSDANDSAIKFARAFTKRNAVISFIGGYYGATYGSMTLTSLTSKIRKGVGPLLPGVYHFQYPNCYRCPFEKAPETCSLDCMNPIHEAFKSYLPVEEVAMVVVEPIQGDSGLVVPPQKFIECLYKLCTQNGILYASEEVQQGFGRTGKWFGIDHFGIVPDLVILGKSIASGMPLSAVVGREEILQSISSGGNAFTTAGNPICANAAIATIDIVSEPEFMDHVHEMGELVKDHFIALQNRLDIIGDVRGLGLSIGIEMVEDRISRIRNPVAAAKICYRCYERGVLLIYLNGNTLRIQPPLIITKNEMDTALAVLDSAIEDYVNGRIPDEVVGSMNGWS
jgi:4-aminobutyrate aminotransferase